MIKRELFEHLLNWKKSSKRKPLILQGARQVGKSHLVRTLGESFEGYVELNFEELPSAGKYFEEDLTPSRIIRDLQAFLGKAIVPGKTLLFLDEVQDCPNAIMALRYFYEKMSDLHIIAAGSLLQFQLEAIGVPVGRVEILHVNPLSFYEFLGAIGKELLQEEISQNLLNGSLSDAAHKRLLEATSLYSLIGGMPEVVASYAAEEDLLATQRIQSQIINTYRQDFSKYASDNRLAHVRTVFDAVPRQLGNKFKYSNVDREARSSSISEALDLLVKAEVAKKIFHSSANGVPLGAERKIFDFKCAFVDIGLALRLLGLEYATVKQASALELVNHGALAEQFVAQELLAYRPPFDEPALYYWRREEKGSNAELDYVIEHGSKVIPIEVKAGATGRLRSLILFLSEKPQHKFGVRIYSGRYKDDGKILHLPLYGLRQWLSELS